MTGGSSPGGPGVLVAVDSGQSSLRLAVLGSGAVHEAPGFSYSAGDPVAALTRTIGAAWEAAGSPGPVARAVLGLTGLPSRPEVRARLAAAIAALLDAREIVLAADNVTAHAGGLPGGHGVVMTIGTGVGCLAVDAATRTARRVDGWGHLFGDDGSAFAVGRAGIAAVLRAVDGRGPRTALAGPAGRRYGSVHEMTFALYTSRNTVDDTARFAPEVVAAAEAGDEVADGIVRAAGHALAHTATAAVATISGDDPVPLARTGRLVEGDSLLVRTFLTGLAAACPRARPVPAEGTSLDGARRLATAPDPGAQGLPVHIYRGS
ncbi:hypothetical protein Skr01_62330 [Sphaerisporangium krabiense]|uniref:N-acetylglucosamine kinase-like BadF-type ATPase n=1 Tax=Sphaerisporangium krabiense TaxID=763782 RepID=A0A7W9DQA2_9ACTN|nr:BadF/BadG/BcrA/BcrD ATPase family protein [Sphaerisporangium krabiense]MBB5626185.1 N-acetylglucosamine kinase-like BadF-type ATPase [Sphaerisporangium krabiense]GII66148.1 hypothetical protein Skr01_62330 [Sphaerisporangium krabiense]